MKSGKFSLKLFLYLFVLSMLGSGFVWSLGSSTLIITKLVVLVTFIAVFILLLHHINKTNRDLIKFLDAIKYLDNVSTGSSSDLAFDQLNITYNEITEQLKKAWLAKEYEHQYFQHTLENIAVGVISFNEEGNIEILNQVAKSILGVHQVKNLQELNTHTDFIGDQIKDLKPNESKLIRLNSAIDQLSILVNSTSLKIGTNKLKLVTLQDIKTQLEQSELEAWQKLIKVLTHEIMNSVTPVKSLTYSMQKLLKSENSQDIQKENLLRGLDAIEKRSKGLLEFVESYKNLTQIKKPSYERIILRKSIQNIHKLFEQEFKKHKIDFMMEVTPDELSVIADEKLISQVLINLIQNAIKAMYNVDHKRISIKAGISEQDKVVISVSDNGDGVDPEILDKIFVPFFSTREGGSGIGLSFARQVMVLHNGKINVQSQKGKGAEFTLTF